MPWYLTRLPRGRGINGERVFLQTAVHLSNYATTDFSDGSFLEVLRSKGYTSLKADLLWEHFDPDGDGNLDYGTAPLRRLLETAAAKDVYVSLAFETYAVGGPGTPDAFFNAHPDAQARNEKGEPATDTEWRSGRRISSIFHPQYLESSRRFITEVLRSIDASQVLYFETSVEPQYLGDQTLDDSATARSAFAAWCETRACPAWARADSLARSVDRPADIAEHPDAVERASRCARCARSQPGAS